MLGLQTLLVTLLNVGTSLIWSVARALTHRRLVPGSWCSCGRGKLIGLLLQLRLRLKLRLLLRRLQLKLRLRL